MVVDLETTGLAPRRDNIIEFGAIRVGKGNTIDCFSALVNPGYKISSFITGLTGITNEMLASAPAIADVLPDFLDFTGSNVIVGHNVNFDINFLYDNCMNILNRPFENDFIDTMWLSRKLFPSHKHHRLCDLVERFEIGDSVQHRALADVKQTNLCYEHMKRYISETGVSAASLFHS